MSFTVSRNRRASGFAQIPNDALRDTGLSARARGVLGYMLTHSDGFEITRKLIGESFTEGRDAIDTAIRELRDAGYVRAIREQGENGRFVGTKYAVYDERAAAFDDADHSPEKPLSGNSATEALKNRITENQSPENPHAYKNTKNKNTNVQEEQKNNKREREEKLAQEFDDWYSLYPVKKGKQDALKAYTAARKTVAAETLLTALQTQVVVWERTGQDMQYVKHPATWLRAGSWEDDMSQNLAPQRAQLSPVERMLQRRALDGEQRQGLGGFVNAIEQ